MHEVIRGSRKPRQWRNNWEPSWKRILENLEHITCATPEWIDWRNAGIAVHELNHIMGYSMCKEAIRKMTNDALIASVCVRQNASLLTCDSDFYHLRRTRQLANLVIIDWKKLKIKVIEE